MVLRHTGFLRLSTYLPRAADLCHHTDFVHIRHDAELSDARPQFAVVYRVLSLRHVDAFHEKQLYYCLRDHVFGDGIGYLGGIGVDDGQFPIKRRDNRNDDHAHGGAHRD